MEDVGKLILRVVIGGLMLPHGFSKVGADGIAGIQGMLAGRGLPELLAYGVYAGEIVAPLLMIVGYFTRPAAGVFAFNMLVAIALAHATQLVQLNDHGGLQLELQYLFMFGSIAIVLLGAGRYSASGGTGRWD